MIINLCLPVTGCFPLPLVEEVRYLLNDLRLVGIFKEENREVKILVGKAAAQGIPHGLVAVRELRTVILRIDTWEGGERGKPEPTGEKTAAKRARAPSGAEEPAANGSERRSWCLSAAETQRNACSEL